MFENNRSSESDGMILFTFNSKHKLGFLWFSSCPEDLYILVLGFALIFDFSLLKLIIYLKASCRDNLENRISVILEVENILFISFIFCLYISKAFSGKKPEVIFFFITFDENTLTKSQLCFVIFILLWHGRYYCL